MLSGNVCGSGPATHAAEARLSIDDGDKPKVLLAALASLANQRVNGKQVTESQP
jgi:hypothetical protein